MIQRLLNEDLKETITKEKKHLADDPGMEVLAVPLYTILASNTQWIIK